MKVKEYLRRWFGRSDSEPPPQKERRRTDVSPAASRAAEFRVAAGRETVEAFVVAFILALLFRAFLAEVFVIPTGSMAPTLMGAHKDLFCQKCDCRFEVGASQERIGSLSSKVVVGGVCPNCRWLNPLDLANDSDQKTFNGDRIVVNKYAYALGEPDRWDVIVFKFPGNPKQNYIKRLVGLPGETITLDHGNVYATTSENPTPTILRKPADKAIAMSHLVYDTDYQSPQLIAAEYPSRLQPWQPSATQPPTDSWQVSRDEDGLAATLPSISTEPKWLRYFHRWPNQMQWDTAIEGGSLADVDPYRSRAITDFYAYNSAVDVSADEVYGRRTVEASSRSRIGAIGRRVASVFRSDQFDPDYESGGPVEQFRNPNIDRTDADSSHGIREGMHWVGELMVTADVQIGEASKEAATLTLELVKAGIRYQCVIDVVGSKAELRILDGSEPVAWQSKPPTASVPISAGSSAQVQLSNYDHMLRLWIDGDEIEFDSPTTYDETDWRRHEEDRPHFSDEHPLDASPVGIAATGCEVTIDHVRIDRDQYYIATRTGTMNGNTEYDTSQVWRWSQGNFRYAIQDLMGHPEMWDSFDFWSARQTQSYVMQQGQYFPLGDNSPGSLDARSWAGSKPKLPLPPDVIGDAWRWHDVHYVPRDLLVGKAVFILWPHPWTSPLPWTPGLDQIEMIR